MNRLRPTTDRDSNFNFSRRLRSGTTMLVGSLALSACATVVPPSRDINPVSRFAYDYTHLDVDDRGHSEDCLSGSAYDVNAGRQGRASVSPPSALYDSATDILTVTPISGKDPLRMTDFKQTDHRVQPADQTASAILASHGCNQNLPYDK